MSETTTTHYHVGWNMPGYLPEMAPYYHADAASAKEGMISDLLYFADQHDMHEDGDTAETLSALAEDLNLANVDQGWDGWTDRLHYWISPCQEECEDDE